MKLIPLFKVTDMRAAIRHYTEVLDFVMTWPEDTPDSPVVDLGHEETELQITTHEFRRRITPGIFDLFIRVKWKRTGLPHGSPVRSI